jgi:hypothetical protein
MATPDTRPERGAWTLRDVITGRVEISFVPLWEAVRRHPECAIIALGVFLRICVYCLNRPYWMDESSLMGNLAGKAILDFSTHLKGDQLAPYAFLIAERAILAVAGVSRYAARFLPLVAGIGSVFLFARLAPRLLSRRAALVALVLFAISDDLIYYSSELKPYSVDVAIAVGLTLAVVESLCRPVRWPWMAAMAAGAAAAPWCSFPSVFVIAGGGLALLLHSLRSGAYRDALAWCGVGLVWAVSFVVCYRASAALLNPATTMYLFWDFAFLPVDLHHRASLDKAAGIVFEVFVNPLNLVPYFLGPGLGLFLPVALLSAGIVSFSVRRWLQATALIVPIILAMIGSMLHKFPFHGRLILELVPAFFLLIAEGTEVVAIRDRSARKLAYKVILVLLLWYPCATALYEATGNRPRWFNSHGDLRDNLFIE